MGKALRYYQIEADIAVKKALSRGVTKQLLVMPGGCGKTYSAVNIVKDMGRKLWISHEESLLEQSAIALLAELELMPYNELLKTIELEGGLIELIRNYKEYNFISKNHKLIGENVGMIKADLFSIDKPIVMASAQTLYRRIDKIPKDWFNVVIADECDLFFSRTFRAPLDYFTFDLLLGLTATPFRNDGIEMYDIFDEIVYEYHIEQAIKDKYLTELNAIVVRTSTNLDDVHTLGGDFNQKELTEKVNTPQRNNLIVNKYLEYCEGQQFICFGVDIDHVIDLHETFESKGIKTGYVVSDKERMIVGTDRKMIVKAYKSGEIFGLINYNIFSAGFDWPDTGCVILGCPTKSKRKFLQQLFRVTRLKGAEFVEKFGQKGTILDIVDGTSKHKLVNTFELDKGKPIEDRIFLSNETKQLLIDAREKREREITQQVRLKDKVIDLIPLPEPVVIKSEKWKEPATDAQLKWISSLGYDIINSVYTKEMCNQIIQSQPASKEQLEKLKSKGYDITGATLGNYAAVTNLEAQKKYKQYNKIR